MRTPFLPLKLQILSHACEQVKHDVISLSTMNTVHIYRYLVDTIMQKYNLNSFKFSILLEDNGQLPRCIKLALRLKIDPCSI